MFLYRTIEGYHFATSIRMVRGLSFVQGNRSMVVGEGSFSFRTGIEFQNGMKLSFVPEKS